MHTLSFCNYNKERVNDFVNPSETTLKILSQKICNLVQEVNFKLVTTHAAKCNIKFSKQL